MKTTILFVFLCAGISCAQVLISSPASLANLSVVATPAPAPSELVQNGGFELGLTYWTNYSDGNGSMSTTTNAHSGTNGLLLSASSVSPYNYTYASQTITVSSGSNYTLTFWCHGDNHNDALYIVKDANHNTTLIYTAPGITNSSYAEVVTNFTAPAGCSAIQLLFYAQINAQASLPYYYDDISVK